MLVIMKKIIGFILVIFCCAIVAFNGNYNAPQQLQTQDSYVYVCTGKYATKYHRYKGCKGLGNCKASIVKMTKQEAEKRGKTPCSLCY